MILANPVPFWYACWDHKEVGTKCTCDGPANYTCSCVIETKLCYLLFVWSMESWVFFLVGGTHSWALLFGFQPGMPEHKRLICESETDAEDFGIGYVQKHAVWETASDSIQVPHYIHSWWVFCLLTDCRGAGWRSLPPAYLLLACTHQNLHQIGSTPLTDFASNRLASTHQILQQTDSTPLTEIASNRQHSTLTDVASRVPWTLFPMCTLTIVPTCAHWRCVLPDAHTLT